MKTCELQSFVFHNALTFQYNDYEYWHDSNPLMTLITASSQGETRLLQLRVTCNV